MSLDLFPGKTYGLFGLNGAGKTTLLNHISGMLFPKKGKCKILGQPAGERLPGVLSELFILPEQFERPTASQYILSFMSHSIRASMKNSILSYCANLI